MLAKKLQQISSHARRRSLAPHFAAPTPRVADPWARALRLPGRVGVFCSPEFHLCKAWASPCTAVHEVVLRRMAKTLSLRGRSCESHLISIPLFSGFLSACPFGLITAYSQPTKRRDHRDWGILVGFFFFCFCLPISDETKTQSNFITEPARWNDARENFIRPQNARAVRSLSTPTPEINAY